MKKKWVEQSQFLNAVYSEIDGKELQISGDYSASRIFEKILSLSTDFHIRVCFDRLMGHYSTLFQHRFASHVCQSLIVLGADVAEREGKGESVVVLDEDSSGAEKWKLGSMEELLIRLIEVSLCTLKGSKA
jgi:hypothetical protein